MGRPKKSSATAQLSGPRKYTALSGQADIVSSPADMWHIVIQRLQTTARTYGFVRVEPPIIEDIQLYKHYYAHDPSKVAELCVTEVSGKQYAVRPSLLPGVLRAYSTQRVAETQGLSKWWYCGNIIRQTIKQVISDYEFGFEVLGGFSHLTEAQVLASVWHMLQALGFTQITLEINSMGTAEAQVTYAENLLDFVKQKKYELCDACNEAALGRVLDVLRCTNLDCQTILAEAPTSLDYLDEVSHKRFTSILEALDELQIPYQLNPLLVGPVGTSLTVAALRVKIGDERTIIIGEAGCHSDLALQLTGKQIPAFGFKASLTVLHDVVQAEAIDITKENFSEVFLVPLGELAAKKSLRLFHDLVAAKVVVHDHFGNAGVKNQLKLAETYKSPIALIMGQKEAVDEMVILRDVKSGMQEMFSYDKIVEEVKKRLGK